MDRDKMEEEIAKMLFDWIDDDGWEWWEVDKDVRDHYRNKTDSILSLPSLRELLEKATGTCVWTSKTVKGWTLYYSCTGSSFFKPNLETRPFCPCCGKRIEVKDGQG